MSLKKELLAKIPSSLSKEPHFQALLDHMKENKIETKEHLRDFLKQHIEIVEKWLEENKKTGVSMAKSIRGKVIELDVLKKCFKLAQNFLF